MIDCRNIAKGKDSGELIVSSEPISFWEVWILKQAL